MCVRIPLNGGRVVVVAVAVVGADAGAAAGNAVKVHHWPVATAQSLSIGSFQVGRDDSIAGNLLWSK